MVKSVAAKSRLGSVIEFRLPNFFVYGVVVDEDSDSGDALLMFAPRFTTPVVNLNDLQIVPTRCKFLFFSRLAGMKENADVMRVVGSIKLSDLPPIDRRFRFISTFGSSQRQWQIRDKGTMSLLPTLTTEEAVLSDAIIPNLDYIQQYYDSDCYPWAAKLTSRGPINFDAEEFENEMRKKIGCERQSSHWA